MTKKKAPKKAAKKKTTKKKAKKKSAPKKKKSAPKKKSVPKIRGTVINDELLAHIVPLVDAAAHLPILAYEAMEDLTVGELVKFARANDLDVAKARRPGKQPTKGQTEATAELDGRVFVLVRSIGSQRKDRQVAMKDLGPKLVDYSDQQIRRSLVRLTERKEIKTRGSTKDKTYCVAA